LYTIHIKFVKHNRDVTLKNYSTVLKCSLITGAMYFGSVPSGWWWKEVLPRWWLAAL